jgi:hypothetical protein
VEPDDGAVIHLTTSTRRENGYKGCAAVPTFH